MKETARLITENEFYDYTAPVKPVIRKLGTISCDVVETTPFVFKNRLYRLEYFRDSRQNAKNQTSETYLHVVDAVSGAEYKPFAVNHHFGSAYTENDTVYAVATQSGPDVWGGNVLHVYKTTDLNSWSEWGRLELPENHCFNANICRLGNKYTMLIECAEPVPFNFRFAQSDNLKDWTLLPPEHIFRKDRYSGGPAIYTVDGDDRYYVFYLEANPGNNYTTCIARSSDLINWEYSPCNPVLMFEPEKDKLIANPYLTPGEQERIRRALDINNSDLECCEFMGRTIINYSWGNQQGIEFLAEACFDGTMKDFLTGFFDPCSK